MAAAGSLIALSRSSVASVATPTVRVPAAKNDTLISINHIELISATNAAQADRVAVMTNEGRKPFVIKTDKRYQS